MAEGTASPQQQDGGWPGWVKTLLAAGAAVFVLNQVGISPLDPLYDLGLFDRCIQNAFGAEFCGEDAVLECQELEPFGDSPSERRTAELCSEVYESEGVVR